MAQKSSLRVLSQEHEIALDGGILGRVDHMVHVRGVNLYPAAVENLMLSLPEIDAYQVEVDSRGQMTEFKLLIELVADVDNGTEFVSRVKSLFRAAFNLRVQVVACPPGRLARNEMKSTRWVKIPGDGPKSGR